MLQLRKILLLNKLYITIFLIVILLSIVRINIKSKSYYNENTKKEIGIVTEIKNQKIYLNAKEKLIINDYSKSKIKINLGDKIEVEGIFIKPENNKNDELFDYKKYLEIKKIHYIVNAKKIKKISNNKNIYYYIKQKILNHIGNNPYLNTFLVGDKSLINKDSIRSYQENGISHLFAISGMHITLLSTIIIKILKKFLSEESAFKYTSLILILYLLLVGLSPSILRGVLFLYKTNIIKIIRIYNQGK